MTQAREQALSAARQPYLAALTQAEQKATQNGKTDELKAIIHEKEEVSAGRTLGPAAPGLTRELAGARLALLRQISRVDQDVAKRSQGLMTEYLKALGSLEASARAGNKAALLEQIAAEKGKAVSQGPAASVSGAVSSRNILRNGNFTQVKADGAPEDWTMGKASPGRVATERGATYMHFINPDGKTYTADQRIERPADAKELTVAVRLRSPDLKGGGQYGVTVRQFDATNQLIERDTSCVIKTVTTSWKS